MVVSYTGSSVGAPDRRAAFVPELVARVSALPGVARASAINHVPIVGDLWGAPFFVEGRNLPKPGDVPSAAYRVVLPGYFAAMGIPIRSGRDVAATDRIDAPPVVVINDYMANKYWPGESAIGKRIALNRPGATTPWYTVIGVVKNVVRSDWAAPPAEELYVPWLQEKQYLTSNGPHVGYMSLVVRADCAAHASCDAAALAPALRNAVSSLDRNLPVADIWTLDRVVREANARPRFTLTLLAVFAAVAFVLAVIGIYGVITYAVSRRLHEIGIRLALGAEPFGVVRMVVRDGMTAALAGAAVGIIAALLLTRSMSSFLYGVRASDHLTFVLVSVLLIAAAFIATLLPARRASHTDPLLALRAE